MYMRFAYTGDSAFLKDTAYPFMRETAKFYSAKLSYDPGLKQYYMTNSNVHETYWGVKNAITDLAAVRSLFPQAIQAAQRTRPQRVAQRPRQVAGRAEGEAQALGGDLHGAAIPSASR